MAPQDTQAAESVAAPYLVAWRLEGRRVVVVGGGVIGTGKIETLLTSRPDIVVVDPTPSERVCDLASRGVIKLARRKFRPTDVRSAVLVVAATGDSATNRRIRRWAKLRGAVVNAVDDLPNCDITVPAVIRRGPATIGITTAGATPAGSRFIREELTKIVDTALPEHLGPVLTTASEVRHQLRSEGTYRFDYSGWRQRFFEPALDSGCGELPHVADRFIAEERACDPHVRPGSVALVGAGPGGADLITVRGARALAEADVVVYDRLADPKLLALAPVATERIPVGKGKNFGVAQGQISSLLIERAVAGDRVVRLKGGDPFVFGRGREEVDALHAAGIDVEIVPGISSALGGPLLAGIPVTDRRYASSFTVVTGHSTERAALDWGALARIDSTLVVLMAASTAAEVARRLISAGSSSHEPVAFVHKAGHVDQQSCTSTLGHVANSGCPFPSPSVMVIGQVVNCLEPNLVQGKRTKVVV